MLRFRSILTLSPLRIAVGYLSFGVVWIPVTDILLALFFSQPIPSLLELAKGWSFVGLSTVLIFSLSHLHERQMTQTQTRLEVTDQQLRVLQRVFRHNIRNDLNVIQGYTERVSEQTSEKSVQNELAIVHQTAEQLIETSEKLKILEEVDSPLSDKQPVDLANITRAEVEEVCSLYPAVTVDMDLPEQVWIEGDTSIRYAIHETLENAIVHYGGEISDCEISVQMTSNRETVTLTIADNGPGIPQEELQPIRIEEETPLIHLSSVGLWLVTWLCDLYDGSVTFDTSDGTDVIFEFRIGENPRIKTESSSSKTHRIRSSK